MRLDNRRVLVVGASRGIGACIAASAAAAGARVVATARTTPELDGVTSVTGDITNPESCRALVNEALVVLGGLDALVYCPAVLPLCGIAETSAETWSEVFDTNVRGAALVTAAALPALSLSRGRALYLSSDIVEAPRAGLGAYGVSKTALDALVEAFRLEVADVHFTRITVGPTLTTIASGWDVKLAMHFFTQWQAAGTAPTAVLAPEDVAARVVELLTREEPPPVTDAR